MMWIGSRNHESRRGYKPVAVVMHIAEGTLANCDDWFNQSCNIDSSAHFCVGKGGEIHQYVEENEAAWGNGDVKQPSWPLLVDGVNPNLYTVSIEHEGHTGEPWTEAMLAADVWLISGICQRWGIVPGPDTIIGHYRINGLDKTRCPGTGLPWDRLFGELKGGSMATDYASYPRPTYDTGVGFHAGANAQYPLGRYEHWVLWIQRMKAMGGTWVKMMIPSTCKADPNEEPMRAVKAAVDAGLEVVVRLHREDPNPGTLTPLQVAQIPVLVALGVHYIEPNNEPNVFIEWKNDNFGDMAREVVGRNWVTDATNIFAAGAWPGLPAMAPGGNLDDQWFAEGMLAEIKKTCPATVLAKAWWACHNYCGNHPIDFPFDQVNTEGTPVSAEEYAKYRWVDNLTRDQVNAERVKGKHALTPDLLMQPGMSNGFRKYEMLHALLDVPVIVTEGGAVADIGFSKDKRYPVMDLAQHAIYSVETARRMMWGVAPSYVLCGCANWLMANRLMENPVETGFESHSWWPAKEGIDGPGIPSVAAMIAMPKQARVAAEPEPPIVEPPAEPAPVVPAEAARSVADKRMETYPWGDKWAHRHGYVPFGDQLAFTVAGVQWYARPAVRIVDGTTALVVFQEGHYTDEETYLLEWTPR